MRKLVENIRKNAIKDSLKLFIPAILLNIVFVMMLYMTFYNGFDGEYLFLSAICGLFSIPTIIMWFKKIALVVNPYKSDVFKKHGSPERIMQIYSEIEKTIEYENNIMIVSQNYICSKNRADVLISCNDVLAIHKLIHKTNFIIDYYVIVITDKYDKEYHFTYDVKQENECISDLNFIASKCKNAKIGYTQDAQNHINKNKIPLPNSPLQPLASSSFNPSPHIESVNASSLGQITPNKAENDTIVLGTIDNVSTPPVTHSLPLKQDDSVRICISKPTDSPISKQRGTYGDDIRIHKPTQSNKQDQKTFSVDVIADGLAELCIKELIDIMGICHKHNVSYDEKKLIISTFCYFYTIWTVNYGQIKLKNYQELESRYTNHFCNFNRAQFETASYKDVIENEHVFKEQLVRVDKRVRESYHANDGVFVDDGISDEFILEFIESSNDKERIKAEIVLKILKNWAHVAHEAGKHSVIDE